MQLVCLQETTHRWAIQLQMEGRREMGGRKRKRKEKRKRGRRREGREGDKCALLGLSASV